MSFRWLREALAICREIGDGRDEGFALNNLGETYWPAGAPDQAITQYRLALSVRQAAGDRDGEATTWDCLATALYETGNQTAAAVSVYGGFPRHVRMLSTGLRAAGLCPEQNRGVPAPRSC
jgi:hypothetical protein